MGRAKESKSETEARPQVSYSACQTKISCGACDHRARLKQTELVNTARKTHLAARRLGLLLRSGCFFVCQSMLTSHLTGPLSLAIGVQLAEIQPVCANEPFQCCMRDPSAQNRL